MHPSALWMLHAGGMGGEMPGVEIHTGPMLSPWLICRLLCRKGIGPCGTPRRSIAGECPMHGRSQSRTASRGSASKVANPACHTRSGQPRLPGRWAKLSCLPCREKKGNTHFHPFLGSCPASRGSLGRQAAADDGWKSRSLLASPFWPGPASVTAFVLLSWRRESQRMPYRTAPHPAGSDGLPRADTIPLFPCAVTAVVPLIPGIYKVAQRQAW
jgi:hypothetical protein